MFKYSLAKVQSINSDITICGVVQSFTNTTLNISIDSYCDLNQNDIVFVNVFSETDGIATYEGTVSEFNKEVIKISNVSFLLSENRRLNNRITTNIKLSINTLKRYSKEIFKLSKPILMYAKNISVSGILLESNLDLPTDLNFIFLLPIYDNHIKVTTEIVRKSKKGNIYAYGCKFKSLHESDIILLKKFILNNTLNQLKYKKITIK